MNNILLVQKRKIFLIFFCTITSVFAIAQNRITGTVTSAQDAQPVSGASVIIKGTQAGTITASDGSFHINAKPNDILVVTNQGSEKKETVVNSQTQYNIVLSAVVNTLNEVLVTGYSSQRKKDITGSVAVVDVKALKAIPAGSAVQALQGQAAGVNIVTSGVPGGRSNILIRGVTSFGNIQPLVMVDGVQADLNNIPADDIESIQVLKDAGAASIYGVRGANGVIVVTTKKGRAGQPAVTYNAYYGVQLPKSGNALNQLNSEDYARLAKIANPSNSLFVNGLPDFLYGGPNGGGAAMAGDPAVDPAKYNFDVARPGNNYLIQKVNKQGTNWYDELFNPAAMQSHNLTMSGGAERANYLFSLGYFNQQGTLIETYLKRYSARINTEFKLTKNIRVGENVYLYYKQNPGYFNQGEGSAVNRAIQMLPIIPVYDIMGNFGGTFAGPSELGSNNNPVSIQKRTANNRTQFWDVIGNIYAEVDFLQNFTARTSFGGSIDNQYFSNFNFNQYNDRNSNLGTNNYNENARYDGTSMWTNTLTYNKVFGSHNVKVLAGTEGIVNYGRGVGGGASRFFSTDFNFLTLNNGTSNISNYSNAYRNTLFSLLSRLDYSFQDKYLLAVTVRRDGSSVFGSEKRYGTFPSVSLGWRLSNERFMKNVTWINDLKLRGSYGVLGSQNNVNPSNALTLYASQFNRSYYDISGNGSIMQGFYQLTNGNRNTGWEENIVSNLGFDATILNNKIDISAEYYKKSIKGLLFPQPIPAVTGGASPPTVNIGDIQNKGLDVAATYRGSLSNTIQFNVTANITTYQNKVIDIPNPGYFDAAGSRLGNLVRNQEDHPVSSFFGYDVLGLFQSERDVQSSPTQADAAPGRFKFRDVNADGAITPDDRTFIGDPNPDFTYGLNLGVNYKAFDISGIFYGSQGNDIINYQRFYTDFFSTFLSGKSRVLRNAWTPENTNTTVPKIEGVSTFSTSGVFNSYYKENGSYLRLRSLQIGFTPNKSLLSRYGVKKMRIYLQGANLFTVTKYTGLDPELVGSSSNFGIDLGNYPNQRSILIGLNASF